ncbi:hypothetical protein [Streptomyces bacillaris]|uniref:hypothetical protein n=1 Tax=Streptomyces bacillaris TaxID=68179 RepID=UPI0034653823
MYAVSSGHPPADRPSVSPNSSTRLLAAAMNSAYRSSKSRSAATGRGPTRSRTSSTSSRVRPAARTCSTAARAANDGWAVSCSTRCAQQRPRRSS